jgi:hypothetical protein
LPHGSRPALPPCNLTADQLVPQSTGQQPAEAFRHQQVSIVCEVDGLTIEPGGHRIPWMFTTRQRGTRSTWSNATSTVVDRRPD